jgi:hypothetical protein
MTIKSENPEGSKRLNKGLAAGLRPDPMPDETPGKPAGTCDGCTCCSGAHDAGQQVTVNLAKVKTIIERLSDTRSNAVNRFDDVVYTGQLMEPGCFELFVNEFHESMTEIYWILEVLKAEAGFDFETKGKWDLPV